MKKIPIILDTDPGVDDAVCLALAVSYPEVLDLKAVCTIGGNNTTAITTRNALDLLQLYGSSCPVYAGETCYLTEPFGQPVAKFHGHNGLGDAQIARSQRQQEQLIASEAIYQIAKENSKELVVVTVGPQTNLAKAFLDHPDLKDHLKKIVVMGGGVNKGNITPYAEANIGHDRFASDIIFNSGVPIDMVGLNVTLQLGWPKEIFERNAAKTKKEVKDFILALIHFRHGEPMHDAIALATLIDDTFLTWQRSDVTIEMKNFERFGETVVVANPQGKIRVAMDYDREKFYQIMARIADYYQ